MGLAFGIFRNLFDSAKDGRVEDNIFKETSIAYSPAHFTGNGAYWDGFVSVDPANEPLLCPITIPNGATITGAIVYGDATTLAETWTLFRRDVGAGGGDTMASTTWGVITRDVTYGLVDNTKYSYYIKTSSIITSQECYGAKIFYSY